MDFTWNRAEQNVCLLDAHVYKMMHTSRSSQRCIKHTFPQTYNYNTLTHLLYDKNNNERYNVITSSLCPSMLSYVCMATSPPSFC